MEISDAAARRRTRMALRQDMAANQGTSSPHGLRDGALQVRAADAVDALERTHQSIAVRFGVCRCDADDCPPGHDEHDTEVSQAGTLCLTILPIVVRAPARGAGRNRRN